MEKIKFTKTSLRDITPTDKEQRFSDTEQPGLVIRVMPSGHMSFNLQRKVKGRTTRISVGAFPEMTIEQARTIVRDLLNKAVAGEDLADRGKPISVNQLYDRFVADFDIKISSGDRRPSSLVAIERNYRLHIKPVIGDIQIKLIDSKLANKLITELKSHTPALHNKCLTICKSLFNFAIDNELTKENPFSRYQKLSEKIRERYLLPEEMNQFFESVMLEPQIYRDAVMILLFTGQRKSCVISMEYREIDFVNCVWNIPTSKMKGKRAHAVPLIKEVMDILNRRRSESGRNERFVFQSSVSKTGHIAEKSGEGSFWRRITRRAGLFSDVKDENLCVHDLRRTLGSWQAMGNESLNVIAKVLGHSDISITSSTYAHLQVSKARGGIESAASAMLNAGNTNNAAPDDKVKTLVSELSEEEKERLLQVLLDKQQS